jgi:hypothetical protein
MAPDENLGEPKYSVLEGEGLILWSRDEADDGLDRVETKATATAYPFRDDNKKGNSKGTRQRRSVG